MKQNITPVFDYEEDERFNQKVLKLVEDKISSEKQKDVKDKLGEIRKMVEAKPSPVHEHALDCPTCKGHTLQISQDVAKCAGPSCGKEFLLIEKSKPDARKKYLCTTCGHTISTEEVSTIKNKDTCPLCNKGKSFVDINWNEIDNQMKNRDGLKRI